MLAIVIYLYFRLLHRVHLYKHLSQF